MLECRDVTKRFPVLVGANAWRLLLGASGVEEIEALRGVTLGVPRGKLVGILGRNGAGKSTLLRVLAGVYAPSSGVVRASGDVGSLFELGGLGNRFITGREYAERALELLGVPRADLPRMVAEVKEFSELDDYFERRILTYSAGMAARLYFAVATAQQHEVYLIDEVLSVGDEHFQAKCWRRLQERLLAGACGLLVTHDWSAVVKLCEESHVLQSGTIALSGKSEKVVAEYLRIAPPSGSVARFGELPASLSARSGEDLDWRFEIRVLAPVEAVEVAFSVERLKPGVGWDILLLSEHERVASRPGRYAIRLGIPSLPLPAGEYSLNLFLRAMQPDGGYEIADQKSWTLGNGLRLLVDGPQSRAAVYLRLHPRIVEPAA
jgi:lipopolysaccharide transport system ATP-binding protein